MMALPMINALIGLLHTILVITLYCLLFRKAGLRGGVFLVAFLPLLGVVVTGAIRALFIDIDYPYTTVLGVTAVSAICYLTPLFILAVLQWPALNNSRAKVEIFK